MIYYNEREKNGKQTEDLQEPIQPQIILKPSHSLNAADTVRNRTT